MEQSEKSNETVDNDSKSKTEILSKKDKIDFAIKLFGLLGIFISFLTYQNTLKLEHNRNEKEKKNSEASAKKAFEESLKYQREQLRADNDLKLRQIEVDSTIKLKQIEIQRALENSLQSITLQNKLLLNKDRLSNQTTLFSETVSSLNSILYSECYEQEYIIAKKNVFNKYYPQIKLQSGGKIILLLDKFQDNLKYYEAIDKIINLTDSLKNSAVKIHYHLNKSSNEDENILKFENHVPVSEIQILASKRKEFVSIARRLDYENLKINSLFEEYPNEKKYSDFSAIQKSISSYLNSVENYIKCISDFIEIKAKHLNDKQFSVDISKNQNLKYLKYIYFISLFSENKIQTSNRKLKQLYFNELSKISEDVIIVMNKQNPILNGDIR